MARKTNVRVTTVSSRNRHIAAQIKKILQDGTIQLGAANPVAKRQKRLLNKERFEKDVKHYEALNALRKNPKPYDVLDTFRKNAKWRRAQQKYDTAQRYAEKFGLSEREAIKSYVLVRYLHTLNGFFELARKVNKAKLKPTNLNELERLFSIITSGEQISPNMKGNIPIFGALINAGFALDRAMEMERDSEQLKKLKRVNELLSRTPFNKLPADDAIKRVLEVYNVIRSGLLRKLTPSQLSELEPVVLENESFGKLNGAVDGSYFRV